MLPLFTKAACSDIQRKIGRVYPDASDERRESSVRTTQSCALSLYNDDGYLDDDTLIISLGDDPELFDIFFDAEFPAIPFSREQVGIADPFTENKGGELTLGNRLILVYNYLQPKCWGYSDYRHAPIEIELPEETVVEAFRAWDRFKADGEYLQHDDYVRNAREAKLTPNADVLLIDEFQDLSPLQYALYKTWRDSGQIDRIYIAGDPDQSIYGFRVQKRSISQRRR